MVRLTLVFISCLAVFVVAGAENSPPKRQQGDEISKALRKAKPIDGNTLSITRSPSRRKTQTTDDVLAGLKDDDVLIEIGGVERLKWGVLKKHVDTLNVTEYRQAMMAAGNEAFRKIAFQSRCKKLLKNYIEYCVFAIEARRLGITVPESEFQSSRAKTREIYAKSGEVGEKLMKFISSGESFYEHNLTNALYWQAYREKVVMPSIKVEPNEIQELIKLRHEKNLEALATNSLKKALIEDVLVKVTKGMDFGEAAEQWSDDDSSVTKGIMMDADDTSVIKFEKGDLDERIEARCWNMREGEMSGVIETPYAWHIVKLLKRNPAKDDEEETVEIAQIKLEKEFIGPEFSAAEARDRIEKAKARSIMKEKFAELVKATPITSKIPLWDADGAVKRTKIRKIDKGARGSRNDLLERK